ncbi:hypothetical protein CLV49_1896 [Labedella gwakjiensis]|uniref:Uncharacterized protein n=1 Tax=Labedella gwakjiensis TaxID=390269 RepID=A0A2P8GWE1_9MICO|nr:hypothetical protein [Labedella gwakjiensis]PSL38279.1 hypothetical protein CLV49_1896 [Labedella gwakjiensis]RUQ87183.1 hypothetical protein ELQ93_09740 [Labedella gwakjiensis]
MAESQDLDPRHDPIYQRGYDPAVHGGGRPPSEPDSRRSRARRAVDDELFAPPGATRRERAEHAPERRPEPAPDTARAPQRIEPPAWSPFAELVDESPGDEDGTDGQTVVVTAGNDASTTRVEDERAASIPPWKNPYLLGLVIGGAVLALVGFQMFRAALETIYVDFAQSGVIYGETSGTEDTPDPTAELVSMQIGWSIGPLLFILGIAAILAVLVFVAVRWRPAAKAPVRPDGEPDGRGPDER